MRLFQEHVHEYPSRWEAMKSIAEKIGCTTETLRSWVIKAEATADPRRNVALADRGGQAAGARKRRAPARQRNPTQSAPAVAPQVMFCLTCSQTLEITTEPSPTAEATRFTDPARTSPTAKMPG